MTWIVACFCGRVFTARASQCPHCGRALPDAALPTQASRRPDIGDESSAGGQPRLPAHDRT